jgi:TetR/AcrR family transcriptional regulator, repressor for uid operon
VPTTASRRPGRPPAAKADETRKRILRAAREVFSERGYDGATFQEIAVRADLTRPAINHYFSSKQLLYCDVVDQTNQLVVTSGIENARRAAKLMDRLAEFIGVAMRASSEDPSVSTFLVTAVLESQRHPELSRKESDAVVISREFLNWAVNDAIEHGELKADTDVPSLAETLLIVLVGVGFYAGYLRNYREMRAVTETLRQLLEGAFWENGA